MLAQRSAGLADAERVWVRLCNRSARWSLDILHHFYLSEEQAVNVLGRTIVGWKILPWQLSIDMVLSCATWRTRVSPTSTIGVWSRAGPFGTRPNWELSNRVFDPQDDRQHLQHNQLVDRGKNEHNPSVTPVATLWKQRSLERRARWNFVQDTEATLRNGKMRQKQHRVCRGSCLHPKRLREYVQKFQKEFFKRSKESTQCVHRWEYGICQHLPDLAGNLPAGSYHCTGHNGS